MSTLTNKVESFKNWFAESQVKELIMHALIIISLLVLIVTGVPFFCGQARDFADKWLEDAGSELVTKPTSELLLPFNETLQKKSIYQRRRLQEQFDIIRARANLHFAVARFYYERYYMAIMIATFSGIVSGICVLFIGRFGWHGVSKYVITVFLVASSSSAFFGISPRMFKQRHNIDENKKLFLAYSSLANKILSFAAIAEDSKEKKINMKEFIQEIDAQISKFYSFPIELEPTKVPDFAEPLKGKGE